MVLMLVLAQSWPFCSRYLSMFKNLMVRYAAQDIRTASLQGSYECDKYRFSPFSAFWIARSSFHHWVLYFKICWISSSVIKSLLHDSKMKRVHYPVSASRLKIKAQTTDSNADPEYGS